MGRESEYLLHLLGAFLRQEAPDTCPEADWGELQRLAHVHNVLGILGYMATAWPICPDQQRKAALRTLCRSTLSAYAERGALAQRLSADLTESGIDHIVMKGYVLRKFYPIPELRTFGDVDLVIRPEDRQRCHERMLALGFQVKNDWEPVFSYRRGPEFYELHTEIMEVDVSDRADYRGYFRSLWEHTTPAEGHCREFTPEYHFLYMLTHIAKHVVDSGAGVRMYLDIAVFLQHYGTSLDWESVRRELKILELESFAATVLAFVKQQWGISCPLDLGAVSEETKAAFAEFTMAGGIFGKEVRDSGTKSLAEKSRENGAVSRTATMVKRLFPSAESIRGRYTYLQEKPWLLPAAWVHRLIKTRGGWQQHAREARDILTADKEEVKALNRFYRDIGL